MTVTTLAVKDANSTNQNLLTTVDGSGNQAGVTVIGDGVNPDTARVTVAQFHNADNQALGNNAYGLNAGGVAQLLNQAGNLDRQREAGADNIPAQGIAVGSVQLALGFQTTTTGNLGTGAQTYTVGALSGTIGGVAWSIQVGSVLSIDTSTNQEYVVVTGVNSGTPSITATFAKSHNGSGTPVVISGATYNQERDAAGEADGATGAGTAIAAEYKYNSGAPGGGNFDRVRTVQGKGRTTTTISSGGGTASKSIVLNSVTGLKAGQAITLYKTASYPGGNPETVYVSTAWNESSTTVPLTSGIVNGTQDTAAWDSFNVLGAGTAGFQGTGIGVEEEVVYDPLTGLYYQTRSATADGLAAVNTEAIGNTLFNETSFDRQRGNTDVVLLVSASRTTTQTSADLVNYNARGIKVILDMTVVTASPSVTVSIKGKDPASGKYYTILSGAAVVTGVTNVYTIYPGATAVSNVTANDSLPRTFQVLVTANSANAGTYSLGMSLLL